MSTSRVPGLTRNSGWQAVDAEIEARARRERQSETPPAKPEPPAEDGVRKLGEVCQA